jgi:hypothetical protein
MWCIKTGSWRTRVYWTGEDLFWTDGWNLNCGSKCQGITRQVGARPALFQNLCIVLKFCVVLYIVCFASFCVLFVCKRVLYNCHRVATHLQLTNIYHISYTWADWSRILYILNVINWYIRFRRVLLKSDELKCTRKNFPKFFNQYNEHLGVNLYHKFATFDGNCYDNQKYTRVFIVTVAGNKDVLH